MMANDFPLQETVYGFSWGPATVERWISDPRAGVYIEIKGKRGQMVVRVTPGGYVQLQKVTGNAIRPAEPLKRRKKDG